jgi:hypothetical protein
MKIFITGIIVHALDNFQWSILRHFLFAFKAMALVHIREVL